MRILKKYPNRRIYDTEQSCYITLADVREMVVNRQSFKVVGSRTGDDLTRSVLMQIIAEMEAEGHESLLTDRVLEELIRFYGDRMVGIFGPIIEKQMLLLLKQQDVLGTYMRKLPFGMANAQTRPDAMPTPDQLVAQFGEQYKQLFNFFTPGSATRGKGEDEVDKDRDGGADKP